VWEELRAERQMMIGEMDGDCQRFTFSVLNQSELWWSPIVEIETA